MKSYLPGAEKGRVPPAWMPVLVASAILNGCFSATCALAMIDDRTTGLLASAITFTSINYWRDPRPGFRHVMDVLAITANMGWHYYLVLSKSCATLRLAYIAMPWISMAISLTAYNRLPEHPGLGRWTNKDWSAALWIVVHMSAVLMNVILYDDIGGKKMIGFCGDA